MRARATPILTLAALFALGCGIQRVDSDAPPRQQVITQAQIDGATAQNVYQLIDQLRPDWFTSRGPTSLTDASPSVPTVFIDGSRAGGLDFLRTLAPVNVGQIRYWPAGEAAARFGMGHPRGVIEVTSRRDGG